MSTRNVGRCMPGTPQLRWRSDGLGPGQCMNSRSHDSPRGLAGTIKAPDTPTCDSVTAHHHRHGHLPRPYERCSREALEQLPLIQLPDQPIEAFGRHPLSG